MDMRKVQRALGFIEGICLGLKDKDAELIEEAVNAIDCELEASSVTADAVPPEGELPARAREATLGCPSEGKAFGGCDTTGEMDELVERLVKHYGRYEEGHAQDYGAVCRDCKRAAETITRLRQIIEDMEYAICAEKP